MRKKEKELTSPEILDAVLNQSLVGHLAMVENNWPYCIPAYAV